jgi:hypothetical protein
LTGTIPRIRKNLKKLKKLFLYNNNLENEYADNNAHEFNALIGGLGLPCLPYSIEDVQITPGNPNLLVNG